MKHHKIPQEIFDNLQYCEQSPSFLIWIAELNFLKDFAGKSAGYLQVQKHGRYLNYKVRFKSKEYKASRLIWFLCKKEDPGNKIVDHINGNPLDNRIENLRLVDYSLSARNVGKRVTNKSGTTGVHIITNKQGKQYFVATFMLNKKQVTTYFSVEKYGYDLAKEMAIKFRKEKLQTLKTAGAGYTNRHGL